jgi:hypothetical protein
MGMTSKQKHLEVEVCEMRLSFTPVANSRYSGMLAVSSLDTLEQWFPTCGTRTPGVTRK